MVLVTQYIIRAPKHLLSLHLSWFSFTTFRQHSTISRITSTNFSYYSYCNKLACHDVIFMDRLASLGAGGNSCGLEAIIWFLIYYCSQPYTVSNYVYLLLKSSFLIYYYSQPKISSILCVSAIKINKSGMTSYAERSTPPV